MVSLIASEPFYSTPSLMGAGEGERDSVGRERKGRKEERKEGR